MTAAEKKSLLLLREQEGLSYEEMAEVVQAPLGTVKSRMHEMVGRLREEMKPWTAS